MSEKSIVEMPEVLLELESSREAPRLSRNRIAAMRSDLGKRFDDVTLVISELVSNSVRHGQNSKVFVSIKSESNRVRLEVSDEGPCFDSEHPRGDGLGLSIVDKVADSWGVTKNEMCTVWAEISLD